MIHPSVVILAAGKGKRMVSALPKVLHRLAGKPLLMHVLDAARALSAERIVVVYGHGGEAVPTAVASADVTCVLQEPQLGTGHALQQTAASFTVGRIDAGAVWRCAVDAPPNAVRRAVSSRLVVPVDRESG